MLVKSFFYKNSEILIWKTTETVEELLQMVDNSLQETAQNNLRTIKLEKRKKEWLISRILLQKATTDHKDLIIFYDKYGKPATATHNISISHSGDYQTMILSEEYQTAIDIQKISEKTVKISEKFLSPNERQIFDANNPKISTLLWSAKETAYKLYGKKELDFRKDIKIISKNFDENKLEILIKKYHKITVEVLFFDDYILTYCEE